MEMTSSAGQLSRLIEGDAALVVAIKSINIKIKYSTGNHFTLTRKQSSKC